MGLERTLQAAEHFVLLAQRVGNNAALSSEISTLAGQALKSVRSAAEARPELVDKLISALERIGVPVMDLAGCRALVQTTLGDKKGAVAAAIRELAAFPDNDRTRELLSTLLA